MNGLPAYFRLDSELSRKYVIAGLVLIVLFSLFIRELYYWFDPVISRDGILYLKLADGWVRYGDIHFREGNISIYSAPLLLWIYKGVILAGGPLQLFAVHFNILLGGVVIPLLMFRLAREFRFSAAWALAGALLIGTLPELVRMSVEVQREMLYLGCWLAALCCFCAGVRSGGWGWWLTAGVAASLAALSRYEGIEFILPFLGWGIWCIVKRRRQGGMELGVCALGGIATLILFCWASGCDLSFFWYGISKRLGM